MVEGVKLWIVNIAKGNTFFANSIFLKNEADRIFGELKKVNFLKGMNLNKFCERLSYYASEINMLHPFREGNGRTSREYLRCLSKNAGYEINYSKIPSEELYNAFVKSVTDSSGIEKTFKKHFIQAIREAYPENYMKHASDDFVNKLNDIRFLFSKTEKPCSINEIKTIYKKIGEKVDKGLLDHKDPRFNLVSNVVTELKIMQGHDLSNRILTPVKTITK